ncbi:MAG: N-acetylmuramoyl-L-alanine amidase [Candidatus Omnitrophica bacterium]|nr:N-acetylmuramoyl-L-alanine amidase [Candidatus Omnitrophota bacterium]
MLTNRSLPILAVVFIILLSGCETVPTQHPAGAIPGGVYHVVGTDQTLWRIAKTYNVDMQQIMAANNIKDPTQIGVGEELFIPGAKTMLPVEPYRPEQTETVEKLVGTKSYSSRWKYITIHHSATSEGNAEAFDRNHRQRNMGGLFYHFVIGNGTASGDGEIEVGWRWIKQAQIERPKEIEICLVGNFNNEYISQAQFDSLVKLISVLQKQYNIPVNNIRRHKDLKGAATECPGGNFSLDKVLAALRETR